MRQRQPINVSRYEAFEDDQDDSEKQSGSGGPNNLKITAIDAKYQKVIQMAESEDKKTMTRKEFERIFVKPKWDKITMRCNVTSDSEKLEEKFKYGEQVEVRSKWMGCDDKGNLKDDSGACTSGSNYQGKNSCGKQTNGQEVFNDGGAYARKRLEEFKGGLCHAKCKTMGWDNTLPESMKVKIREGCIESYKSHFNGLPPDMKPEDIDVFTKNVSTSCKGSHTSGFFCKKNPARLEYELSKL